MCFYCFQLGGDYIVLELPMQARLWISKRPTPWCVRVSTVLPPISETAQMCKWGRSAVLPMQYRIQVHTCTYIFIVAVIMAYADAYIIFEH
jgi:hypothetical protein